MEIATCGVIGIKININDATTIYTIAVKTVSLYANKSEQTIFFVCLLKFGWHRFF